MFGEGPKCELATSNRMSALPPIATVKARFLTSHSRFSPPCQPKSGGGMRRFEAAS